MTRPDPIAATRAQGVAAALSAQPRTAPGGLTAWEATLWLSGWDAGELVRTGHGHREAPRAEPCDEVWLSVVRRGSDGTARTTRVRVWPHVGLDGALTWCLEDLAQQDAAVRAVLAQGRAAFAEHAAREQGL